MQLTPRETATVLAALRYWQKQIANTNLKGITDQTIQNAFPLHFGEYMPLLRDEIDSLCERINTDSHDELVQAVKDLIPWVARGIVENAYKDCVLPRAADAALRRAEALLEKEDAEC